MNDLKVTLNFHAYKENLDSGYWSELADKKLQYSYVEFLNKFSDDVSDKVDEMYFLALENFLVDYLKKHPEFVELSAYHHIPKGKIQSLDEMLKGN